MMATTAGGFRHMRGLLLAAVITGVVGGSATAAIQNMGDDGTRANPAAAADVPGIPSISPTAASTVTARGDATPERGQATQATGTVTPDGTAVPGAGFPFGGPSGGLAQDPAMLRQLLAQRGVEVPQDATLEDMQALLRESGGRQFGSGGGGFLGGGETEDVDAIRQILEQFGVEVPPDATLEELLELLQENSGNLPFGGSRLPPGTGE